MMLPSTRQAIDIVVRARAGTSRVVGTWWWGPYKYLSAVVKSSRPDGIAVMALVCKYLEQGRRVGKWGRVAGVQGEGQHGTG